MKKAERGQEGFCSYIFIIIVIIIIINLLQTPYQSFIYIFLAELSHWQ